MNLIMKNESYLITGLCMEVHHQLGAGFAEIVYKDALEYEFQKAGIPFEREKQFSINYKGIILPHLFYAEAYFHNHWRPRQISVHLPLWVAVEIDSSDSFLKEKI